MEANKDESIKCFKMAKAAFSRQDFQKAIKLATKANNMFPDPEYEAFIDKCTKLTQDERDKSRESSRSGSERSRSNNERTTESTTRNATAEQENLCRKIVNSKDYYEMLQVSKTDSVEKIKKSYKKLALKLHPDKNPSPLASEAFKKVSTAFQCLTNPKAREEYDLHGDEERVVNHRRYEQEFVTPEQLFEAFFGMSHPNRVFHFTTRRTPTSNQESNSQRNTLLQIAPLFILLVFMLLSNLFSHGQDPYQFEKSGKFTKMMSTNLNGVVYYVEPRNFERNYPSNTSQRVKIEYEIEYKYFQEKCNTDKRENQKEIYAHISSLKSPPAELYQTPKSCKILNELRSAYTQILQQVEF